MPLAQCPGRARVTDTITPVFRLMVRLGEATGMRLTDIRRLRVQQMHDAVIDLAQSKTGNDQQWEITPAVQAILDEAARLARAECLHVRRPQPPR